MLSVTGILLCPSYWERFTEKKAETIASLIIPMAWLGIVAAQIIAAAKILSGLNSIDYPQAAVISGIVFIVYTLLGGQMSILKTDTLQSVLILAGIIALLIFTLPAPESMQPEALTPSALFNESF